ncbi:MAG: DUF1398 family protein [Pseudolabrys sp.]|nr:DUF1398 family protein [Pseudolabrys sp.]
MDTRIIAECMQLSFANTPFPQVLQKLAGAGVQAYTADLISLRSTYYDENGAAFDEKLPLAEAPPIASRFDADSVANTMRTIQRGEIGYVEFLQRVMNAGCASYRVFLNGGKVIYFGRDGDALTEPFPALRQ